LVFELITAYLYYQPYEDKDKICKQNIVFCQQKCESDFDDFQAGFIAREQYSYDIFDREHGIVEPQKLRPKLSVVDFDVVALQDITHACLLKLLE
jgi:hypothetical protein